MKTTIRNTESGIRRHGVRLIILSFISCLLIPVSWGYSFAGGTGEPNDPYQIATAQQLIEMGQDPNLLSRHFVLVADIDLDPNLPGGKVFSGAVIAPDASFLGSLKGIPFAGTFNGQGYTIRHLTLFLLAKKDVLCSGVLFGVVGPTGIVRNLILADVRVTNQGTNQGTYPLGGLAGVNAGQILHCSASGSIIIDVPPPASLYAGGLVGYNQGTLVQCCSATRMFGGRAILGGLVGYNRGAIMDCYATGPVDGGTYHQATGGLAGSNTFGGQITRCYAIGSVVPMDSFLVGGLVGDGSYYEEDITLSYFLQDTDGGGPNNGLGRPLSNTQMNQQDSFGFWDFYGRQTDGTQDPWFMPGQGYPVLSWQTKQTGLLEAPDVAGLSEDQAAEVLTHAGFSVDKADYDYDPCIPAGRVLGVDPGPFVTPGSTLSLWVSLGTYDWTQNPGNGIEANPYQLASGGQLDCLHLRPDLWYSDFVLTDDLDMRHHVSSEAIIAPDQDPCFADFQGTGFGGRLNGGGHAIKNLTLTTGSWSLYVGLVGYVKQGAEIRNLRLEGACVTTGSDSFYVGILAGRNLGTILDCSVQGTLMTGSSSGLIGCLAGLHEGTLTRCQANCHLIASGRHIGGLTGVNYNGQISMCIARGSSEVKGLGPVGGVAGVSSGGISDSYSMLDIALLKILNARGILNTGGLVGYMPSGASGESFSTSSGGHSIKISLQYKAGAFIRNCYATGRMSGVNGLNPSLQLGGLVANSDRNWDLTVGSVWDMESTGAHFSYGGTGLMTAQMQTAATFQDLGWDFDTVWTIRDGKDYPRLWWEQKDCSD